MNDTKYNFGSIVVVEENLVGVVVKCWADCTYEVYVRAYNGVSSYKESEIQKFIYDKILNDES